MTLTLQPMTTAPRTGEEVWCLYDESNFIRATWSEAEACWVGNDQEYTDESFSGWLDLAALVRDSERLALVILMFQDHEWVRNLAAKIEHPHDLDAWRTAIDKEAGRG